MPSVAIYDLLVHPREHDLIAGTHGRGIWVLDDLTPIEYVTRNDPPAQPVLFPIRTAYTWYPWWTDQYGDHDTDCCVPAGVYAGDNPDYGAILSYQLSKSTAKKPWIDILDSRGKLVRRIDGTNYAGVNRVTWDLTAAPPIPLKNARRLGCGAFGRPDGRAWAVCRSTACRRDTEDQPLAVAADPRAAWTQAQYEARYAFLNSLNAQTSDIDDALNRLDALSAHATGTLAHDIATVRSRFTSGVVNSEDDQWMPDRVRERLMILQGDVALSQGPPLAPHLREAAAIRVEFETAMAAYHSFLAAHPLSPRENDK